MDKLLEQKETALKQYANRLVATNMQLPREEKREFVRKILDIEAQIELEQMAMRRGKSHESTM